MTTFFAVIAGGPKFLVTLLLVLTTSLIRDEKVLHNLLEG